MDIRRLPIALVPALALLTPAPASAARYFSPLVAGAKTSSGQSFGTSLRLPLRTDEFQVIRRPSRSSITVGFPKTERVTRHGRRVTVKARPCAIATYSLSLAPGSADPLAQVRQAVPDAGREGTERGVRIGDPVQTEGPPRRAWRLAASFDSKGRLHTHGTSIEQLLPEDPFGPPVKALRTITLTARMLRTGAACGGGSSFTLGPGVTDPIVLG